MLIKTIKIQNYGVFRGSHTFNLTPDIENGRPIILFGGLNGSGKTTLFESIKLCLYGQPTLSDLKTRPQYHSYISKKIRPLSYLQNKRYFGAIDLVLEYNDFGIKAEYSVRRQWKIEKNKVYEKFRVLLNGQMIGSIEQENSQNFIANIIPMGISNLFFFDGEKIQELAQDSIKNGSFKDALDSVLGLDVIQTLERDLKSYAYKENATENDYDIVQEIEKIQKQSNTIETQIEQKHIQLANIKTRLDRIINDIEKNESELTAQGAGYAKRRVEFQEKLASAENLLEEVRNKLKLHYSELFPFTIVPELSEQLKNIINSESRRKNQLSSVELIDKNTEEFSKKLVEKNDFLKMISVKNDQITIINDILDTIKEVIQDSNETDFYFINDFSEKNLNQLLYWVEQTNKIIPNDVDLLSRQFTQTSETRIYYENLIRKVPEDSMLEPIVTEINKLYSARGKYESQQLQTGDTINELKIQKTELNRLHELQLEKFEHQNKHQRKIKLLKQIRAMLTEYTEAIRDGKIEMLRTAFLDAISMIIRKHDFINDIQIDSDYNIQLQREDGHYIYKSMLSNGEKQIFAISMLLALARVSGKPLPFIIDTPLARLDSDHRDNIVQNFFPNASHQVIIFSTDTEVDKVYFEKLAPHLTRVYHLEWNPNEASSTATEGYFWNTPEVTQD
jgi:DNA sulfur modification protein DndD